MDTNENTGEMFADRRLFVSNDGRLVEEGDESAAYLLASPGSPIPAAEAKRLGLELKGGKVSQGSHSPTAMAGGALLDPRGALEAAVKDKLKAEFEVKVKEEADKEAKKVEGEGSAAHQLTLNRAGQISREALASRGELTRDNTPATEAQAKAEAEALKREASKESSDAAKTEQGKRASGK
jgi:hypothetical protein